MQHTTELLVVTLAHIHPGNDRDALARIRAIVETLQSAPGLLSTRIYRGHHNGTTYLLLTTWEDEESWLKAQERHTPKQLLLSMKDMLVSPPEQWLMYYLWGYNRPTVSPVLACAHLISVTPQQMDMLQNIWLNNLRQPALQDWLTYAFLARGTNDTPTATRIATAPHSSGYREVFQLQSTLLFSFFSWSNESEREAFYADTTYQAMQQLAEQHGIVRTQPLEAI
ncbi:antibiotic biosynthesis monooxygenase family protein [Dictyobacter arantiisoli]|uniref:ABM domain-containing protein n=1 Tax=Dictyobacter arantiisoli TaxID=2014874 RepID=A0A5A5TIS4_9CHLR|nr:antibiotic biosynthesis monooxygenase family protein [Dictyobacter arantiisoli]GCF11511.1 hypothetical protein KDI_50750 [Dictyobacter arantiisoli]